VVLGGGSSKKLKTLPAGCIAGDNANAFLGGFRLWGDAQRDSSAPPTSTAPPASTKKPLPITAGGS
jgi:hypothetical protein